MSYSNSTNTSAADDLCQDAYYYELGRQSSLIVYFIISPIYFFVGLFGDVLFLLVVISRSKTDGLYVYQAVIAACGPLYVVLRMATVVVSDWLRASGRPGDVGPRWWWTCYGCVWYSAHLNAAMPNLVGVFAQFLVIFMLADRFRALYKPLAYKPPTTRTYVYSCVVCALASLGLGSFEFYCCTIQVTPDGTAYWIDYEFDKIPAAAYTSYVRSVVLSFALLTMYAFNVLIPLLYYKIIKAQPKIFTSEQECDKRRRLRTLMGVAMCQSVAETVCQTLFIALYIYIALPIQCKTSRYPLFISLLNLGRAISTASNFYVLFAFSRDFRRDAIELLRKWFRKNQQSSGAVVVPVGATAPVVAAPVVAAPVVAAPVVAAPVVAAPVVAAPVVAAPVVAAPVVAAPVVAAPVVAAPVEQ